MVMEERRQPQHTYVHGEHDVLVDALVTRMVSRPSCGLADAHNVYSVCIEGPTGSGKTTIIRRAVDVATCHVQRRLQGEKEGDAFGVVDDLRFEAMTALDAFASFRRAKKTKDSGGTKEATDGGLAMSSISAPVSSSSCIASQFTADLLRRIHAFQTHLFRRYQQEDSNRRHREGGDVPFGTLCVLLDGFDMFLGGQLSASAIGVDDYDSPDDGTRSSSSPLHSTFAAFAGEFFAWVRGCVDGAVRFNLDGSTTPSPHVQLLFIMTSTSGGDGTSAATAFQSLQHLWFQDVYRIPPLLEEDRESYFLYFFEAQRAARSLPWISDKEGVSDGLHVVSLAKALACRTGGLVFSGLEEVAEQCCDTVADHIVHEGCLVSGVVDDLSDTTLRAFFASGSQQALAAKQRIGYVDVTKTQWADIAGLADAKKTLKQLATRSRSEMVLYESLGVLPRCGVLLYGPPGTGKTMLAKAMAAELNASFLFLDLPQLLHSEVGESERILASLFLTAKKRSPCIMFIDELQSAFGSRGSTGIGGAPSPSSHDARLVSAFLALLDDAVESFYDSPVIFVGATNVKDHLDPLLLRSGRLDTHIFVGNPDAEGRLALISRVVDIHWAQWWTTTRNPDHSRKVDEGKEQLKALFVDVSEGMSGAELAHALNMFSLNVFCSSRRFSSIPQQGEVGVEHEPLLHWTQILDETCIGTAAVFRKDVMQRALIAAFPRHSPEAIDHLLQKR